MLHHVVWWILTDVSEEHTASTIVTHYSETSVSIDQTTRCSIPAGIHLHVDHHENLKSHKTREAVLQKRLLHIETSHMLRCKFVAFYEVYHLKCNPSITYCGTKMKPKQVHSRVMDSVKVTLIARPLMTSVVQKQCKCEHGVFISTSFYGDFLKKACIQFAHITHGA
jgi:hypothetical protein